MKKRRIMNNTKIVRAIAISLVLAAGGLFALSSFLGQSDLLVDETEKPAGNAAGMAIGRLKSKEALEPILENFDGEESVQVRARMVNALGNLGGEKAKAKLRSVLEDD